MCIQDIQNYDRELLCFLYGKRRPRLTYARQAVRNPLLKTRLVLGPSVVGGTSEATLQHRGKRESIP